MRRRYESHQVRLLNLPSCLKPDQLLFPHGNALRLQEISEVPVLLSVMTMALMHSNQMPSSLFELYATWLPEFPRVSEPKWNISCRPRVLQGHGSAKHFGKSAGQARRGPQGSNVATHAAGGAAQPAESETWLDRALALPIAVPIAAIGSCSMPLRRDPAKEAHLHPERCGDGLGPEAGVLTHLDKVR